jgi:AcrR family transcriptional regulator
MEVGLSRREREKRRQRGDMLAAALELFSEKGYHHVSMKAIAKRAEFALGTIYRFFANKEDLYKAAMLEKAGEYHRTLTDVLSGEQDILAALNAYVTVKARIFAPNVEVFYLYFAETGGVSFNLGAGLHKEIGRLHDDLIARLASVMEKGVRAKLLRNLDPHDMAVALEGLTNAFLLSWLKDPERHPYEESISTISKLFLEGSLAG